jgi:hypothetical protein
LKKDFENAQNSLNNFKINSDDAMKNNRAYIDDEFKKIADSLKQCNDNTSEVNKNLGNRLS